MDGTLEDDGWEDLWWQGEQAGQPEVKSLLDNAYAAYRYPSTADTHNIADQTGPSSRQVGLHDAAPHYGSEYAGHSDFTNINATAPLDPVSVQSDVQGNSSWLDNTKEESIADSGFFSAESHSIHQSLDPSSNYSTSFLPYDTGSGSALGGYADNGEQALDVSSIPDPWHPGARVSHDHHTRSRVAGFNQEGAFGPPDYFLKPDLYNSAHGQTSQNAAEYHPPSVADEDDDDDEYLNPPSISESLRPPTVSSEATGSARLHTRHTSVTSGGPVITCDVCGAQFTGRYGRGNCSRHMRQTHSRRSAQQSSDCVCRVCKRSFARQDARRKHEWRKHGLQDTKPCPRRQSDTHEDGASHDGTYDLHSDQGTLTRTYTLPEEPATPTRYRVPAWPLRAHDHFAAVQAELTPDSYTYYCNAFLEQGTQIVEVLRNEQSHLHRVFDLTLRNLSPQLLPEQPKYEAVPPANEAHLVDADQEAYNKSPRANQARGKAQGGRRTSNASARQHPYPHAGRTGKKTSADPLIALLSLFEKPACVELDCPVHKWYSVHPEAGASPCNGCEKKHMNGVRQHLLPTYSQQHGLHVSFMRRCEHCKEDIVEETLWESGRHDAKACPKRTQPRDITVLAWARVYLKIFPGEDTVTSPYVNDPRYLPDELVTSIRQELGLIASVSSSLTPMRSTPQQNRDGPPVHQDESAHTFNATGPLRMASEPEPLAAGESTPVLETLITRTAHLLQALIAHRPQAMPEPVDAGDIETEYYGHHQAQNHHIMRPDSQDTGYQGAMLPPQSPITGAADFQMRNMQPDVMAGMLQVPGYMSTQPSTHGHYNYAASNLYHSHLDSSQTSYDYRPPSAYVDQQQPQSAGAQFRAPLEPWGCPPANYFPDNQGLGDPRFDIMGSSRLPQITAEDMMEASPSLSRDMSASRTPNDFEEEPFDVEQGWYNQ